MGEKRKGESCSTCGRQDGRGRPWLFDPDGTELGRSCFECGNDVDSRGDALGIPGPDGEPIVKVFGFPDPFKVEDMLFEAQRHARMNR